VLVAAQLVAQRGGALGRGWHFNPIGVHLEAHLGDYKGVEPILGLTLVRRLW